MNHSKHVGVQEHWCGLGQYYSCLQWVGECPLSMACVNTVHMWLQSQARPWFPELQIQIQIFDCSFVLTSLCKAGLQQHNILIKLSSNLKKKIKKNHNLQNKPGSIQFVSWRCFDVSWLNLSVWGVFNISSHADAIPFHCHILSTKFLVSATVRKSWCWNSLSEPLTSVI